MFYVPFLPTLSHEKSKTLKHNNSPDYRFSRYSGSSYFLRSAINRYANAYFNESGKRYVNSLAGLFCIG